MSTTLFEVSPMGRRDSTKANRKSSWVSIKPFIWGTPEQAQKLPLKFCYFLLLLIIITNFIGAAQPVQACIVSNPSKDELRIPIYAGRVFRFEAGHRSDLKPATIPK
jgi:hypothetical protein